MDYADFPDGIDLNWKNPVMKQCSAMSFAIY